MSLCALSFLVWTGMTSLICRSFLLGSIRRPSVSLWASYFHVGDSVTVLPQGGGGGEEGLLGRIQDVRGSGWYSVELLEPGHGEVPEVVKCRSTQLRIVPSLLGNSSLSTNTMTTQEKSLPVPSIRNFDTLSCADDLSQGHEELSQQVELFQRYQKWVAFTDLHCATATVDACIQVLEKVHFEASQREAGILFLGDWWHVRGSLRVDLVNAMLSQLSTWTQPMIMIPGNHDQISRHANEDHALRVFHNAYRIQNTSGVMVMSYPTQFMNALFVPHIRSPEVLESILKAATDVPTIFCHADITGSSMNDNVVSQGGINPSAFGGRVTYTGHFHKPHVMANHITYLGSPYEVSLAEAEQEKALVVLDRREDWNIVEQIKMGGIGRKHFKPADLSDFERVINSVKAGDRVVFDQPNHFGPEKLEALNGYVKDIRNLGAVPEIRPKSATKEDTKIAETRRMRTEATSSSSIWSSFLAQQADRGLFNEQQVEEMSFEGLKIMAKAEEEAAGGISMATAVTKLQISTVHIQGFGPFVESTSYTLDNKGLVLLRGVSEDDGADSNGSGKTSLAVSVLWAFTGSIDPRPVLDGRVSEVINDLCPSAKVTVQGTINGSNFTVSRTKTRRKGELLFFLDDKDRTAQAVKETQKMIDDELGISASLLSRVVFHGQHATNDLLDAPDAKLKEELSQFIPLSLWQKCRVLTSKATNEIRDKVIELSGMIKIRTSDLDSFQQELNKAEITTTELRGKHASLQEKLENESNTTSASKLAASSYDVLEQNERQARDDFKQHEKELQNFYRHRDDVTERLRNEQAHDANDLRLARGAYNFTTQKHLETHQQWQNALNEVSKLETKRERLRESGNCPLCLQKLGDDNHAEESIVHEIEDARKRSADLARDLDVCRTSLDELRDEASLAEAAAEENEAQRSKHTSMLVEKQNHLELELEESRAKLDEASEAMKEFAKMASQRSDIDNLLPEVSSSEQRLAAAVAEQDRRANEVARCENELEAKAKELAELEQRAKTLKTLTEAFGSRGVQSFVLQNALSFLGLSADSYLAQLSQGTQKLELSLDTDDRISRRALVRGADSVWQERALSALSGGQWRRTCLAMQLAVGDYVRQHCLQSSLVVFDEPLIHLDQTGRADVGRVFRSLLSEETGLTTLIVILQDLAADELDEYFDCIDEVVRSDGRSRIVADDS